VSEYAESIVIGEADGLWPTVVNDFAAGRLQRVYRQAQRPALCGLRPDRSIFAGKRYLPVGLIEAGRGCHFRCEFCAIQSYFNNTQTRRPTEEILEEVQRSKKPLIFFCRRQHHVEYGSGQGIFPRADSPKGPLGEPGQHQRRAR
jgi:radical SAM superfamily enzyme YgiQ (UPF0313 family)